jgi:PTS system nitrogen regulatory IIA component
MKISDLLSASDVMIDVPVSHKAALLQEFARGAAQALDLPADVIAAELLKREQLGSTGLGGGVAIPHARIANLKKPYGVVARLSHAIDFEAIDGQPVDIAFLVLLPDTPEGEQLNALACVARRLRDPKILADLRRGKDRATLFGALTTDAKKTKDR